MYFKEPILESSRDQLPRKRKRLEDALKKKNIADLDAALSDFELLLNNDQKKQERALLDKAYEEKDYLRGVESKFSSVKEYL